MHAFGELFPFGPGGIDKAQPVQISLIEFVRYCLRLSTRRRAQHRPFALVAFDVLDRHNAIQVFFIKAGISPHGMEQSAGVSRDSLQEYVQYQPNRAQAISEQRQLSEVPQINRCVRGLYSNISTGVRAFWGRSGERANQFSMQLELGQPAIFSRFHQTVEHIPNRQYPWGI